MIIPHEYIDKDELLFEMTNAFIPQDMDTCRAHSLAKKLIANAPTADVEPVRHGEWIPNWGGPFILGNYCSLCNHYEDITIKHSEGSNYCPNCGAKMDGGKR